MITTTGIVIAALTGAAIIIGPIAGGYITLMISNKRHCYERKLDILRSLMRTRQLKLNPDHVAALNIIELEFYGQKSVIVPYHAYIKYLLNIPASAKDDQVKINELDDLFLNLLHALGKKLGYKFDKHELGYLGYAPRGWEQVLNLQTDNNKLINELLRGDRPLPVCCKPSPGNNDPFPPSPEHK